MATQLEGLTQHPTGAHSNGRVSHAGRSNGSIRDSTAQLGGVTQHPTGACSSQHRTGKWPDGHTRLQPPNQKGLCSIRREPAWAQVVLTARLEGLHSIQQEPAAHSIRQVSPARHRTGTQVSNDPTERGCYRLSGRQRRVWLFTGRNLGRSPGLLKAYCSSPVH